MNHHFTINNYAIQINDATLQYGEQAPSIAFNVEEKIAIALVLSQCAFV
ncbi:hypothetical protein [Nostoc sp.]